MWPPNKAEKNLGEKFKGGESGRAKRIETRGGERLKGEIPLIQQGPLKLRLLTEL